MEKTIEDWIRDRISSELHENAKTINGVLTTLKPEFTIETLDPLIDSISKNSTHRTTIISAQGIVLADSELNQSQISKTDNHGDRPEILTSTQNQPGSAIHYSSTTKYDMMYLAIPYKIGTQEGFVRVAISLLEVEAYLNHFRKIYLVVAVISSLLLILVLFFAFRFIQKLHKANERDLVIQVKERTDDLVKIQKLSQVLSSCQKRDELVEVISSVAPSLFPGTSGALSITHPSMDQNEVITSWGDNWQGEGLYPPTECWAFRQGSTYISYNHGLELKCKHLNSDETTICVPLLAQSVAVGALHLIIETETRPEVYQQFITMADHLSLALSNINLRESLKRQAVRDPLTNLYNRRYLDEVIENEILRAKRKKSTIGIMMIDIDHFKKFNDTFGHHAGDHTLQIIAKLMTENLRAEDTVSRYGGEEFLIVMPDSDLKVTLARANLLLEKTRDLNLSYKNKSLGKVTLSIGVSIFPEHGETSTSIVSIADQALYTSKTNGRDQAQIANITFSS